MTRTEDAQNDTRGLPEIMTADECAAYLRFTPDHVRRLARQGKIPAHKVSNEWRFSRRQVLAWVEAGCPPQPRRLTDD